MKKFIHYSIACVLLCGGAPLLQAQSEGDDFTTRITNPSFEGSYTDKGGASTSRNQHPDGWTLTRTTSGWTDIGLNDSNESEPASDGSKYYNVWVGEVTSLNVSQKITLPTGKYKLTAALRMSDPREDYLTDQHIFATMSDGVVYKSSVLSTKGIGKPTGEYEGEDEIIDRTSWDTLAVIFNATKEQTLTVGVASTSDGSTSAGWFQVDDFRLTYMGEPGGVDINTLIVALQAQIAIATNTSLYNEDILPQGTYYAMMDLVDEANRVSTSTPLDEAQEILQNLTSSIQDADEGILLLDTLLILYNKSLLVPNTFPDYTTFAGERDNVADMLYALESTNDDFKIQIASFGQSYRAINEAEMDLATSTEGRDATWLIENPDFTRLGGDPSTSEDGSTDNWNSSWTYAGSGDWWIGQGLAMSGPAEGDQVNAYQYNGWNYSNIELTQTINSLPAGAYTLSCSFHTKSTPSAQWIYANGTEQEVKSSPSYQHSEDADPAVEWWEVVTTEKFYVGTGSALKIGFYCQQPGGNSFCGVDLTNWTLTYYGNEGASDELVAGLVYEAQALLDNIEIKDMIMPVEKEELKAAILLGQTAEDKSTAINPLKTAIANAKECVSLYPAVDEALFMANEYLSEGQGMAKGEDVTEFEDVINAQYEILDSENSSRLSLAGIVEALTTATLRFQLKLTLFASEDYKVNVTLALANPTVESSNNQAAPDGWTCSLEQSSSNNYTNQGEHYTGETSNTYFDSYNGTEGTLKYTAQQTITVPNGNYILRCAARSSAVGVYLFAEGATKKTTAIIADGATGGAIQESGEYDSNSGSGYGWNYIEVTGITVENNTLTIGITNDQAVSDGDEWVGTWFSVDDFVLLCTKGEGLESVEDTEIDPAEDIFATFYTENGYIKTTSDVSYTVTSISGAVLQSGAKLAPGAYLVTVNGKTKVFYII